MGNAKENGGLGTRRPGKTRESWEKTETRLSQLLHVFNSKNYFYPIDK